MRLRVVPSLLLHSRPILALVALGVVAGLLSGCAMTSTAPATNSFSNVGTMKGSLHGGQQAIAFATVQIWSVGTTGYGSAGQLFATAATADDGYGTFTFSKQANTDTPYAPTGSTWACPATGNPEMYILAKGGNTQGNHDVTTQNAGAGFLLAVGRCSKITATSYFTLNEVTTVGSMAALTQYFNPVAETVGSPASTLAQNGITNAFAVISNLIDITGGTAMGRVSHTYHYTLAETAKMNTMGDVLAACVNTPSLPSANCTTLFANAYPPVPAVTSQPGLTLVTATDVLQALWYMLANPSDGSSARLNNLYGLVNAGAPFLPTISSAPTDWTLGITLYTVPGQTLCGPSPVLNGPTTVAISPLGYVTVTNTASTNSGWQQFTGGGNAYACEAFSNAEAREVAIDTRSYVWTTLDNFSSLATAYTTSGNLIANWATPEVPYGVVADGAGNIFYTAKSTGSVYEIRSATIAGLSGTVNEPPSTSSLVATLPGVSRAIVADAGGNLWIACSDGNLYELTASANYAVTAAATIGTNFPGPADNTGLVVDAGGGILLPYNPSGSGQSVARVSGSPTTGYTLTTPIVGVLSVNGVAVDGAGNVWQAPESSYNLGGVNTGFVYVTTATGTPLVTPYGITKPANSSEFSNTLVQNSVVLGTTSSLAIDLTGNVWVANAFQNMFNTTDGEQFTMTELVGAAVPVVPITTGLMNGTVGTKP